jgi:DNA-binding transcriptional MocR family regulator
VYIKSYNKVFIQGIAYMVVPLELAQQLIKIMPCTVSGFIQRVLYLFIQSGGYARHTAAQRGVYGKRYRRLMQALDTYLAEYADYTRPAWGLRVSIYPRAEINYDINTLCQQFLQQKVIVTPGELYNQLGFSISIAAVPEERIAKGIGIIAAVLAAARTEAHKV